MEHLEAMDYLRSSVNLRAYGQREPIVEYKKDGLMMFKEMEETFKEQVFSLIGTIQEPARIDINEPSPRLAQAGQDKLQYITSHSEPSEDMKSAETDSALNIGRNDPCPCGAINPTTGEVYKWKKCGLINAPQHRKSLVN
jgi:preprotein translocase subunit SecA